jgi:D-xylose transport system substrate-binding protein
MKVFLIATLIVLIGLGGYYLYINTFKTKTTTASNEPVVIGLSLGTLREERWLMDRDYILQRATELNAIVNVESADSDAEKQISQIEKLVAKGVKAIIVVPQDAEKLAAVVSTAHSRGVHIIAYDRLIKNADLDLYISFDNEKVGELEAQGILDVVNKGKFAYIGGAPTDNNAYLLKTGTMRVLDPLIKKGDIILVVNEFTPDWRPDEAYKTIKRYLDTGGKLDAVVAANDGTAFGVIQALKEKGLDGKVPVSGQDAELAALQRIVQGTQTVTVYKPIKALSFKAVELALQMVAGKPIETNAKLNNGQIDVPAYYLNPVAVTKTNITDTIIKDNFHTYDEIYKKSTE